MNSSSASFFLQESKYSNTIKVITISKLQPTFLYFVNFGTCIIFRFSTTFKKIYVMNVF